MQARRKIWPFLLALLILSSLIIPVYAADTNILGGDVIISNNSGTLGTPTDNSYNITAGGGMIGRQTVTLTITNKSGASATLAFNYTASNYGSFTISSATPASASASYSILLDNNASFQIVIAGRSGMFTGDATLILSDITLTAAAATSNVTINYDSTVGSVTAGGSAVGDGTTVEGVTLDAGIALVASPKSGTTFLGWIDANGNRLSTETSYTLKPASDTTVTAAFASSGSDAWFLTNGLYYNNLNQAAVKASNSTDKTIVLLHDGTLPADEDNPDTANVTETEYTIPSGVTLLIPCDNANTVYTTKPGHDDNNSYTAPTVYRKLTMEAGANITVNGAISIGGKAGTHMQTNNNTVDTYYTNGAPSGPLGYIDMASESSITVQSGGNLYAWGFITGSGSVTVKSGGTVHEDLQIRDYRGGDATTSMIENDSFAFPFSQYYIQNIEAPLTLEAGAIEKVCMTVSVTVAGVQQSSEVYIGNDSVGGLLRLTDGSITKTYKGDTDRIIYDLDGDISFGNLSVSIKVAFLGSAITINSEDYVMPITHNMTLNVNGTSAVVLNQNLALLPGSIVNIAKDATVTLGSGNSLFVYDQESWKASYVGIRNILFSAVKYAPGLKYTRTNADLKDAEVLLNGTVDATNGFIYTTGSGANIHSEGGGKLIVGAIGTASNTYQPLQSDTNITGYDPIPVTSAKLLNGADAKYVETAGETGTYTYYASTGRWDKPNHFYDEKEPVVTAPTFDADGYTTYTCAVCNQTYVETNTGSKLVAIAEVDGEKFASLTAALAAVRDGGTVTLLSTPEADVVVAQCVTIDTANTGYTVVCGDGWAIDNKGNGVFLVKNPNLFCIYGTSVKAGDSLDIYFYIQSTDLTGEGYYAEILRTRAGADSETVTVPYSKWSRSGSYMRFSYDDIAAKEMTDEVYVTIYNADHQPVSNTFCESVERYAVRVLNGNVNAADGTKEAALRTALVDMLNYGAGCQDFFNDYNINDLANARIDSFQIYATEKVTYTKHETHGAHFYGPTITAENSLYLTFYFADIADPTGMRAVVTYKDHYGNDVEIEVNYTDFRTRSSYYGIDVTGLAVADGRQPILCTVYNADGTTFSETTCSVECYAAIAIANNTDGEVITKAGLVFVDLMKFVDSARAYFHYAAS